MTTTSEKISGSGSIDMRDIQIITSGSTAVGLSNINQTLDPNTHKEFTIILPPGEYAAGMNFNIETSDGQFMNKVTATPITVTRSKVLPLTAFEVVAKPYNFPDKNFRAYLKKQGYVLSNEGTVDEDIDINNAINKGKFTSLTNIDCHNKSIASLKGIEHFTALTSINCENNQLTVLDLSANTALTSLFCGNNQFTSLDLSANTALQELWGTNNRLTSLDLPATTALTYLDCQNNRLMSLDLTANTALESFSCNNNQLSSLDLPATTALKYLYCGNNRLMSLDLSANTALKGLECYSNQLKSLDLTHNTVDIYLAIGAQVAADGTLLDMTAYVSENQTSELGSYNNERATLKKETPPTPASARR